MLAIALLFSLSLPLKAEESAPFDVQAKIFAKAMEYDRKLLRHDAEIVRVAFLEGPGAAEVRAVLDALGPAGVTIAGKPVSTVRATYTDAPSLVTWLAESKCAALFIPQGMSSSLADILGACRAAQVGSLAGDASDVAAGVAFGVAVEEGKPRMLVNLKQARAEGSDYTAQFLRLGRIVER